MVLEELSAEIERAEDFDSFRQSFSIRFPRNPLLARQIMPPTKRLSSLAASNFVITKTPERRIFF